ncbi:MAG TPA: type II toxin-antitoxin system prevent-host-death family antitoxin [Planctomycetota bacterium]|nr:type II toxin-antitoxin system prevent-host-death family antitoxin [Planctomycetota bacterium]
MYHMYMKYNKDKAEPADASVPVHRARRGLADLINKASYAKERILLGRRGKAVAAIVPLEDVRLLEALEDRIDIAAARKALREARGKKLIPWTTLKAELGL